ncbi:hypothetical protein D3C76_901130 [compost metagenome]
MGQVAHFIGDDRKAPPGLACARRLDCRVEGQQVGLLGNAGDDLEDLPDVHGFAVERFDMAAGGTDQIRQAIHRLDAAVDYVLPFFGQVASGAGVLGSLRRVVSDFLGGSAQLVDRGSHAIGTVGLFVAVEHRRVGGTDHAQGHFVDVLGGRRHFPDGAVDAFDKAVERVAQNAEFIMGVNAQALGQVAFAFGDVLHGSAHGVQWLQQEADQHAQQGDDEHHRNDHRNDRRDAEFAEHRIGLVPVHGQADVPVDRRQAFYWAEGQDAAFAVHFDFAEVVAQAWGILREQIGQRLHDQVLVWMDQDLAIAADQEREAHAAEIKRIDNVGQGVEAHVSTDHAGGLATLVHG